MAQAKSIAYINQIFPSVTQTFVYREVWALRNLGLNVRTFSIFRPDPAKVSQEARPLLEETFYAFPLSWPVLILAHLWYLFTRPLRYLGTFFFVLTRPGEPFDNRRRTLVHFIYAMIMVREVERLKPEHIHAHFGWSASTVALIAHRLLGIPFSVTFHSFHARDAHPRRLLAQDKIRSARFVVAISAFHRDFLATFLPQDDPGDKIHVVRHGLDPVVFVPADRPRENGAEFRVVGVGQLIACKGFDVLIEACHYLAQRDIPVCCHILGEGPERKRLEGLIDQYNLHNRVFLPGRVDQSDLRRFLNDADVFALPALKDEHGRQDGLPVVLTEAMAMELPVVSTTITAIPELVKHRHNGLLVSPRDAVALADALQQLNEDPELRRRLGRAGRETVVNEFNMYRSAEQLAQLFQLDHKEGSHHKDSKTQRAQRRAKKRSKDLVLLGVLVSLWRLLKRG